MELQTTETEAAYSPLASGNVTSGDTKNTNISSSAPRSRFWYIITSLAAILWIWLLVLLSTWNSKTMIYGLYTADLPIVCTILSVTHRRHDKFHNTIDNDNSSTFVSRAIWKWSLFVVTTLLVWSILSLITIFIFYTFLNANTTAEEYSAAMACGILNIVVLYILQIFVIEKHSSIVYENNLFKSIQKSFSLILHFLIPTVLFKSPNFASTHELRRAQVQGLLADTNIVSSHEVTIGWLLFCWELFIIELYFMGSETIGIEIFGLSQENYYYLLFIVMILQTIVLLVIYKVCVWYEAEYKEQLKVNSIIGIDRIKQIKNNKEKEKEKEGKEKANKAAAEKEEEQEEGENEPVFVPLFFGFFSVMYRSWFVVTSLYFIMYSYHDSTWSIYIGYDIETYHVVFWILTMINTIAEIYTNFKVFGIVFLRNIPDLCLLRLDQQLPLLHTYYAVLAYAVSFIIIEIGLIILNSNLYIVKCG